jgi:nitroreductase
LEFQNAVLKRRMVRHFAADPIPDRAVKRVLELAQHGPSAGFSQGVAYVVVRDNDTRKRLGQLQGEEEYVSGGFHRFFSGAPVVVVVCLSEQMYHRRYQEADKLQEDGSEIKWSTPYWFFDAGASSMIILLGAVDAGYSAAFAGVFDIEGVRKLLNIPGEFHPVGTISIGKPLPDKKSGSLKRGRRPWNEVVHLEKWQSTSRP